ncbi:hypothetical protein BKA61DRAFT_739172 [Leptodontidium sp. MPI-SDFR-AT-0119]|nr:hypothetical protein BKA61DRAFT_739172 [Leptodontidium sp. MPI-SDFR-AT-0119]
MRDLAILINLERNHSLTQMALSLGKIYDRKSLWPASQRKLERQQFDGLDEADQAAYDEYEVTGFYLTTELERAKRPFGPRGLNHLDVEEIIDRAALSDKVVDFYMDMICAYVNSVRRPVTTGVDHIMDWNEEHSESHKTDNSSIEPMEIDVSAKEQYLSCCLMTSEQFRQCNTVARAKQVLEAMDLTREKFKKLDYLLIAYSSGGRIAPRQKFVVVIDSITNLILMDNLVRGLLMRILFSQVDKTETWPLYTQRTERSDETLDGSPNLARQGDMYNCGLCTVTNAFCLAFGFDMLCWNGKDLDPLKRPCMLMELSQGGLGGKYAYDLLDIPNGPLYTNPVQQAQFATDPGPPKVRGWGVTSLVSSGPIADDADFESGRQTDRIFNDPTASGDDTASKKPTTDLLSEIIEPDDLDEAHGMVSVMEWVSNSGGASTCPSPPIRLIPGLGSRSRALQKLIPSAEKAIKDDYLRCLPAMHKAWDAEREYVRESEIERLEFPPQLSPKYFQKLGFLYPCCLDSTSEKALSQYTADERKAAYALSSIEGIEEWENESPEIIDWWARNKMAAFAAKYWGETVAPDSWLTEGYEEWLKEHSAKERERI